MIWNKLLNDIIKEKKITDPAEILTQMDLWIKKELNQEKTSNQDWMDMAICIIDKEKNKLTFSWAKNPLIVIQDNKLLQIKWSKSWIWWFARDDKQFENTEINISEDTYFYMFSDWFADQFWWGKGRKFMIKNFKELLLEIHQKPIKKQKNILKEELEKWMWNKEQVDDILVMWAKILGELPNKEKTSN